MKELIQIQSELKAPKGNFNSFGKYHYRSQEDILEALKPLLLKYECVLSITDEVKQIGTYTFIESTVCFVNKEKQVVQVSAQAGISDRKGMDIAQSFGSSSSYARKYALNGLFLIDDTKDADASNTHGKEVEDETVEQWLIAIAGYSDLETLTRNFNANKGYINSTPKVFEAFKTRKQQLSK